MFSRLGMGETALSVDTENPFGALRVYESAGYREDSRYTFSNQGMNPMPTSGRIFVPPPLVL